MPQQPRPDPARAARARQVAMYLADTLFDEGIELTWPRFLQVQDLVASMLPPAELRPPVDLHLVAGPKQNASSPRLRHTATPAEPAERTTKA